MKTDHLRSLTVLGFLLSAGCSTSKQDTKPEVESGAGVPVPEQPALTLEEQLAQEAAEGKLLQAALDEQLSREEQRLLEEQNQRETAVDFAGTLTDEEKQTIRAQLASDGVGSEQVEFRGRVVLVDGDGYFSAESLLAASRDEQLLDKGYVLDTAILDTTSPRAGTVVSPIPYAFNFGGIFHFWRPAVSFVDFPNVRRRYYLVVADNIPSKVKNALIGAAADIEAANSNDCIGSDTFRVRTVSQWNAFSNGNKMYHYRISVNYSDAWPQNTSTPSCGSIGAYACGVFPRLITKTFASADKQSSASRLSFGSYVGINKIIFASSVFTEQKIRPFLAHEIGHLIGLSHPFPPTEGDDPYHVPGTLEHDPDVDCLSFMDYNGASGVDACPITDDDKLTIRKLYTTSAPQGCDYANSVFPIQ